MRFVAPPPRIAGATELLDAAGADPALVHAALDDLARINRLLGGTRLTLAAVGDLLGGLARGSSVTFLDAACGGGDIAAALARWARARGLAPHVIAVDASPVIAARAEQRFGAEIDVRVGDIRSVDLPDRCVDVAACSLVLHHFEPDEAVGVVRELRRVARRGIVVNDLVRSRVGLLGAHAIVPLLTRNPITRTDAALSVRRAYTRGELLALLREAGARPRRVRSALGYRVAVAARVA